MSVDPFNTGLLPHQGTLLYVQHAVFYTGYACAPRRRPIRCGTSPAHRPACACKPTPYYRRCDSQSPIKRGGIVRSSAEVFLVHGFGLERPDAVPLKPELLFHHKSVFHKLVRDNASNLFAGLALFSIGGVDRYQRTQPCWLLVVAPLNTPGRCSWRCAVCSMSSPPSRFAMNANAGALRTGFSLATRRSRKSTDFSIIHRRYYTNN